MYQLTALYKHPEDTEAFDKHYRDVHAGLTTKMPGLRTFRISRPAPGPDGAQPLYYLVATLGWDSEAEFQAAAGSPEGEATMADMPNFAGAGVDVMAGPAEAIL
jgi:uncharacterized protein (TIGR02118 family)